MNYSKKKDWTTNVPERKNMITQRMKIVLRTMFAGIVNRNIILSSLPADGLKLKPEEYIIRSG